MRDENKVSILTLVYMIFFGICMVAFMVVYKEMFHLTYSVCKFGGVLCVIHSDAIIGLVLSFISALIPLFVLAVVLAIVGWFIPKKHNPCIRVTIRKDGF